MIKKGQKITKQSLPTKNTWTLPNIKTGWAILILLALTVIIYGQTINFSFTWFDDDAILIRNQTYISDFSNLPAAFLRDAEFQKRSIELYRPLQNISYMIDAAVGGFSPTTFHRAQLIFFVLVILTLYFFLKELNFSNNIALLGTALIAVHPIAAYTVGWLPARGDLLLSLTALLMIITFIRFIKTNNNLWLLLHVLFFFLAILSKESAIALPVICGIWYLWVYKGKKWLKWQWILLIAYAIITIFYLYVRSLSIASGVSGNFAIKGLFHHLPVIPEMIMAFFLPLNTSTLPFYSMALTVGGMAIILILAYLSFRKRGNQPLQWFAVGWFSLLVLPSMLYQPDWSDYIYDYLLHRSFLPLVGILLLVMILLKSHENKIFQLPFLLGTGLVVVLWSIAGYHFAGVFSNQKTFWTYTVKTNPYSSFAQNYMGNVQFYNQQPKEAIASYTKAIELRPDLTEAILNRGIAYASTKNHPQAIADFNQVMGTTPKDTAALRYRANSYFESGKYEDALQDLNLLLNIHEKAPSKVLLQHALSNLLIHRYDEAQKTFSELLKTTGEQPHNLRFAAIADLMSGDTDAAIEKNLKAMILEPPAQQTLTNLGYAYWEKGAYQLSLDHFIMAKDAAEMDLSIALGLWIAYDKMNNRSEMTVTEQYIQSVKPELFDTSIGIDLLVSEGYFFTEAQKKTLNRLIALSRRSARQ